MARVAFVVQHHPSRAGILPRLLERLPADTLVVVDPGGEKSSPWRCYRLCLRAAPDASHIVVIQDDAVVCDGFYDAAVAAISARSEAAIAFFVSPQCRMTAHAATLAMKKREPWAEWSRRDFWPTVASAYPVSMAVELTGWVDGRGTEPRCDDSVCGDAMRAHPTWKKLVTVPSLAQHPDDVASLIGRKHLSGLNPARCAKWWIGDKDPAAIKWG